MRDIVGEQDLTFGPRLRRLREAAGLTQQGLAVRAGLSPRAISALERGERQRPYPHTVRTLADALGLSEEERASLLDTLSRRDAAAPATIPDPTAAEDQVRGSPQRGSRGYPLLLTKLSVPSVRASLVPRPRLSERIEEGTERKLTLVSAPAGFGKTTLLSVWTSELSSGRSVAWLSLDAADNDPARFWRYFVTAVDQLQPGSGETALALLGSPQAPPIEAVLTTLLNELADLDADVVFVLDDYHLIESRAIHEALTFLIEHLPARMHLIISTRADAPLPLARLRARGESNELRAADLRFTPEEAATFLDQVMGLKLSAEDIGELETRTEGWIAGLQMAALAMRDRADVPGFIEAFTGSHRYILDYLVEEVLDQQPEGVRSFLLETSVLGRMCGPLGDAVTGRPDGQATLERLEHANLFVVALDDERRWYRYHHLFADVLHEHLCARPGSSGSRSCTAGPARGLSAKILCRRLSSTRSRGPSGNGLPACS
jgi:ATP/maltotriose-dependent transcriptional regulator MalT/DNA-binding XRE family transcriptional regulator